MHAFKGIILAMSHEEVVGCERLSFCRSYKYGYAVKFIGSAIWNEYVQRTSADSVDDTD